MVRPTSDMSHPELPPGWTQHTAPTGHPYYYHASTNTSTYKFPGYPPHLSAEPSPHAIPPSNGVQPTRRNDTRRSHHRRPDKPKSKYPIPDCEPWVLVKTRLGRRFVHNTETHESLWQVPAHVLGALVQYDIKERERREKGIAPISEIHEDGAYAKTSSENGINPRSAEIAESKPQDGNDEMQPTGDEDDETYEEIEVVEEEEEGDQDEVDGLNRPSFGRANDANPEGLEFGEDDIQYQLDQMADHSQPFGSEEVEDDLDQDLMQGAADDVLTEEQATAEFGALLDDYGVNPFSTWDEVIDQGRIVEDSRYTLLPNMKARKDAFANWSSRKAQEVKAQRAKEAEQDPRIPYLELLQKHATPKLYWPEFKRKFKKEPEIKDTRLTDKWREKVYRDYINRTTKFSEKRLVDDLRELLRSIKPSTGWNRQASLSEPMPSSLLGDVRYISVQPNVRDAAIQDFIQGLPKPEDIT